MTTKKAPSTLFGEQIRNSPRAHKLSVALNMTGISIDIPTAHLVLKVFEKMDEMGGNFDLHTACKILEETNEEYRKIQEKFNSKQSKTKSKKTV